MAADATPEDIEDLIELYFEVEDPVERDEIFERLAASKIPEVDDFLLSMMREDDDEIMQMAAACELARRQKPEAIAYLEQTIRDTDNTYMFEEAARTLAETQGPSIYDVLQKIWLDPKRDRFFRRSVMGNMLTSDEQRALADFTTFVESIDDPQTMLDEQVEAAMVAFGSREHQSALPALTRLRNLVQVTPYEDPDEQREIYNFISHGMALLED